MRWPTRWEIFWILTLGPFFSVGWLVWHATHHLNRFASRWCRFLLSVYPD